jgi:hypothetical protein
MPVTLRIPQIGQESEDGDSGSARVGALTLLFASFLAIGRLMKMRRIEPVLGTLKLAEETARAVESARLL